MSRKKKLSLLLVCFRAYHGSREIHVRLSVPFGFESTCLTFPESIPSGLRSAYFLVGLSRKYYVWVCIRFTCATYLWYEKFLLSGSRLAVNIRRVQFEARDRMGQRFFLFSKFSFSFIFCVVVYRRCSLSIPHRLVLSMGNLR